MGYGGWGRNGGWGTDPMQMMMAAMMGGKGFGKGKPRHNGKACVKFSSAAEAKKAISTLNGQELDGRALELDTWTDKEGAKVQGGDASVKVYVKNLAWKTRGWKLKELDGRALELDTWTDK